MTDTTRDIPDNVRNVLVIMTDQHRTDTIGCLGNPHAQTPVIDAMGESGFAFTHCFTPHRDLHAGARLTHDRQAPR